MKKLTIIVPIYKTEKYIKDNVEMWKDACKKFEVHFIQDSLTGEVKSLAKEVGAHFHKKENGNWGSVINYAKNKIKIVTPYIKIVDADDAIYVDKLIETIDSSNGEDLLVGNVEVVYSDRVGIQKSKNYMKSIPFVHTMIIKSDIFLKISDLPEGWSFMDSMLKIYVWEAQQSIYKSENIIYRYFRDLPGQSTDKNFMKKENFVKATQIMCDILLENPPYKSSSIGDVLSRLEDIIWRVKENGKYKRAYKKLWSIKNRELYTNYFFVIIAGIFKKKIY